MINKPNQNCEFGCESGKCKHDRSDSIDQAIVIENDFPIDFEDSRFLELDGWYSDDLEKLESRFEEFVTVASTRKYHQR